MFQTNGTKAKMDGQPAQDLPDPEVVPTAKRCQFSTAYKHRVLEEAEACTEPGEVGALLRREGLYSSYLTSWRRQRERDQLEPRQRGCKGADRPSREIARLQQENDRLRAQLARVETIIDVPKKLSSLFGLPTAERSQDDAE